MFEVNNINAKKMLCFSHQMRNSLLVLTILLARRLVFYFIAKKVIKESAIPRKHYSPREGYFVFLKGNIGPF